MNMPRAKNQTFQDNTPRILNQSRWTCLRDYKKFEVVCRKKLKEDLLT